jgi:hypothetical protein
MITNKIISYSLWGDDKKYTYGALRNAELAEKIYPGWTSWFYIGTSTPKDIIDKLSEHKHVRIIHKDTECDWTSMFWRFEAAYHQDVDVCIFRDTDSRLSSREKEAVSEWLASDKTFHIMRDHPFHGYPILGGMWGYKNNHKYDMESLLESFDKNNKYGIDYEFFATVLYPLMGSDKIVHDEFFEKIPFPTPRNDTEFVGDVFDENNNRHSEYYKHILK